MSLTPQDKAQMRAACRQFAAALAAHHASPAAAAEHMARMISSATPAQVERWCRLAAAQQAEMLPPRHQLWRALSSVLAQPLPREWLALQPPLPPPPKPKPAPTPKPPPCTAPIPSAPSPSPAPSAPPCPPSDVSATPQPSASVAPTPSSGPSPTSSSGPKATRSSRADGRARNPPPAPTTPPPSKPSEPSPPAPPPKPAKPTTTPDDPRHLRECSTIARATANAYLVARGLELAELARLAAHHDPSPHRSRDCRLNILAQCLRWRCPPARSIGWLLVTRALRAPLASLCNDPAWIAEQEAHANRPASPRPSYSNRLSALRPSARRARRALRDLMAARGMCRVDMARAMSALSPISTGGPYDILGPDPTTISRYWPLAARALGVPLSALCDDPAWIAAQPQGDASCP